MLTTALGCTSPLLYAAFGSKEGLYRKALAAYRRNDDITPGRAPDDLQPCEMVERYLHAAATEFVNKDILAVAWSRSDRSTARQGTSLHRLRLRLPARKS